MFEPLDVSHETEGGFIFTIMKKTTYIINYPFYAKIKKSKDGQFYPILYGLNNEPVFTGETHKNRKDVVELLTAWFPQIKMK